MLLRIAGYVDRVRKHLQDLPFLLICNAGADERAHLPEEGNIIKSKDAAHGLKQGLGDISIASSIQPSKMSQLQHPLINISGDDYEDMQAEMQFTPTPSLSIRHPHHVDGAEPSAAVNPGQT